MSLIDLVLGRRLASNEQAERKIGVLAGLPTFGLDGLASSAYGPEAALTILLPLGAAGLRFIEPITLAILALLSVLYISYRQTIAAYPNAGGSYVVARENLGPNLGLLAAAALLIDYILNVAVGISAGIAALVSAVPSLQPYTLALCLVVLAVITLVNLRGTLESGWAFGPPTYLFVGCFAVLFAIGIPRALMSGGHPLAAIAPRSPRSATESVSLWLLLRAFASGCTAMTGVEAVSNGVGAFREPTVKHAHRTLTAIIVILAVLLGGIAYLSRAYGIEAMDQSKPGYQSVLSQLIAAIVGRGPFYYVTIASVLAILSLSANTSFADLPRLCGMIAKDGYLPAGFATVGRRLVFSVGIVSLAATAGLLLTLFGGITDRLIPLFAIGAFLAFTLSQAGMVMHWWKRRSARERDRSADARKAHTKLAINAVGASATAAALAIILTTKFREGAWITILMIPLMIVTFKSVRRYYDRLEREVRALRPLDLNENQPPVVLVATERWNRLTAKALRFGMHLSQDVIAIHLSAVAGAGDDQKEKRFRADWRRYVELPAEQSHVHPPRLITIRSDDRTFAPPLLKYVIELEREFPLREIAIIVPELVKTHWWEHLLHNHRARRLRAALLRYGGPRLVLVSVPWHLDDAPPPALADDVAAVEGSCRHSRIGARRSPGQSDRSG
jgi:amino acid transporter